MPNAIENLIAHFAARGVTLAVVSGRIRYHPRSALGPEDVEQLRVRKRELIAHLSMPAPNEAPIDVPANLFSPVSVVRSSTAWWSGPEAEQCRRLNIICTNPRRHRTAWRSIFGSHLHCGTCTWPPPSMDVVAELIDLDSLLEAGRRTPQSKGGHQ